MTSLASNWFRLRLFPTWRLLLPLSLILSGIFYWQGPDVYGWLAVTERISGARYVVVEGWAPDYVLLTAKHEFDDSNAKLLLTAGLPLDQGMFLSEYKDFATLAAATLVKIGMESGKVYPVPVSAAQRHRTAAMATALRGRLDSLQVPALDKKLLLVTFGTHARRSHIIYQRALGSEWEVGVVSVPQRDFPQDTWYKYSSGMKGVIGELAALLVVTLGGE
ncbi:MAG: hypothetical protein ACJAYC_003906 [Halieaceae bacterium]|jgi:hypothetical protein